MSHNPASVVVAIPAKNEAERLPACLAALDAQVGAPPLDVVLLLNNCSDDSLPVARAFARTARSRLHIEHVELPQDLASAGLARHLAMKKADQLVGGDGVLLTTDADSVAPPDWIAANLAALDRADAVAGRAVVDCIEAEFIPASLHEDDARECAYATMLDEIASLLDPDEADPWPRHDEHSGASIAVRAAIFRRAGGVPPVPSGEDRALFRALRQIDARVRHAPEVWVTVSGRLDGRAAGGMAETIRRRMIAPDLWLDDRLETVATAVRRARLRRGARLIHLGIGGSCKSLARALMLNDDIVRSTLSGESFGVAWYALEALSPVLRRRRVRVASLPHQMDVAETVLRGLKAGAVYPADIQDIGRRDRHAEEVLSPA